MTLGIFEAIVPSAVGVHTLAPHFPAKQSCPHAPQFFGSCVVSAHMPPQHAPVVHDPLQHARPIKPHEGATSCFTSAGESTTTTSLGVTSFCTSRSLASVDASLPPSTEKSPKMPVHATSVTA